MSTLYGVLAAFDEPDKLVAASAVVRQRGFSNIEAYSPFPVEGLDEALSLKNNHVALYALVGGITGALCGFFMQYYATVLDYPVNIGGKPMNSWPAYIPVTFALTILFAALSAALGMLAANKLPQPYHPIFNSANFSFARANRFYLCVSPEKSGDEAGASTAFDVEAVRSLLKNSDPLFIEEVMT